MRNRSKASGTRGRYFSRTGKTKRRRAAPPKTPAPSAVRCETGVAAADRPASRLPLQVTFHNMQHSERVESVIREEAESLGTYYGRIMGCRVVVDVPHRHHEMGNRWQIRVDLTLPGWEIAVSHTVPGPRSTRKKATEGERVKSEETALRHKHIEVAVQDAFDTARRRLQDFARRRRGAVKTHEPRPLAYVRRLFPEEGYGILETADGREVYFHRNSLLDADLEELRPGMQVVFTEEMGYKGPQASTVRLVASAH